MIFNGQRKANKRSHIVESEGLNETTAISKKTSSRLYTVGQSEMKEHAGRRVVLQGRSLTLEA